MRIWFNHWFTTAYHLINLIKTGDPGMHTVIGSSKNSDAIYRQACDEWYLEADKIGPDEYVAFCVAFCKEHSVDVFAPRRFLVDVVKHAGEFSKIGVKLLADTSFQTVKMLDDKMSTYAFFKQHFPQFVPEVRAVCSVEEFLAAYEELKESSTRVCYKLAVDEGARSFRVIDEGIETADALLVSPGTKITLAAAQKVLAQYDFSVPLLLMPYLSGTEISVDCLATDQGSLTIPRYKIDHRFSEVTFDRGLMDTCSKIVDSLQIKMPLNIQFKMECGEPYLLEINPRMSGGLQLSCMASGINIPNLAVNQLFGISKHWRYPDVYTRKVAHLESPICLD